MTRLMIRAGLLAALLAIPAPARAVDTSAYCSWGTGELLLEHIRPGHEEHLFARCQPGDTIGIPADYVVTVARVCDFARPIVALRKGTVVCVLRPPRGMRASE
jgi:hypothetical protein